MIRTISNISNRSEATRGSSYMKYQHRNLIANEPTVPPQSQTDNRRWGREMINFILGAWTNQMNRSHFTFSLPYTVCSVFFFLFFLFLFCVCCHFVPLVCLSVVWLSYRYQFVWLEAEGIEKENEWTKWITKASVEHTILYDTDGANSILVTFLLSLFFYDVHISEAKKKYNKININWNTVTTYNTSIESGQSSSNFRKVWLKCCKYFFLFN